uniref:Uncharacterized protein n=2 Tax=Bombyx mori TaxID=7091 RepID=A0A8R2LW77_BOMMO|nr:uncharacterized protein LOC105841746 isoform X3 [Bombyx mori]
MNGHSDASTSTDDVKSRPLCLFYFTHPFGVLSPEPPCVTAAPPHVTRAFLNMQPVSPFDLWSSTSDPSYNTDTSDSSRPAYDLGNVTVHKSPVNLISLSKAQHSVDFARPDSISSSLFSSDIWFNSGSTSRSNECSRRVIPYNRILPPLQMTRTISDLRSPEELWPKKCLNPEKFSLPPIELPALREETPAVEETLPVSDGRKTRIRRREGVVKVRCRRRVGDARRVLVCLMRRVIRGGEESSPSPALRDVLQIIREAWTEPTSLFDRCAPRPSRARSPAAAAPAPARAGAMLSRDASPGLLRRRYSVPETIMRRYRVVQQRTECEESTAGSAGSGSGAGRGVSSACATPHPARDRELMRKSALLRRMWGRAPPACCRCCCDQLSARPSRSLDGSHAELRPRRDPVLSASTYRSHEARGISSCVDTVTDTDAWRSEDQAPSLLDETVTAEIESASGLPPSSESAPRIPSSISTSLSTGQNTEMCVVSPAADARGTPPMHIENALLLSSNTLVDSEAPSLSEVLEIVVTETSEPKVVPCLRPAAPRSQPTTRLDIDRYVSDVLVESLNSLSDRLECVTGSVEGDGKISIVEKEIKVRLHSTGVNTIVHLSPTSNHQIIFGNEELCDGAERDACNNLRGSPRIRDDTSFDDERNNNRAASAATTPAPSSPCRRYHDETFGELLQHDNVNKTVLQQIQKLFKEELQSLGAGLSCPDNVTSGISHIEISNVDVFLDENDVPTVEVADSSNSHQQHSELQVLSGVGTGSYFETSEGALVVPRFSALPHSDSMEVNTSSSEEADLIGSDCTSLVDSLDDPNSPRSVLLRRSFNNRKSELVRSALDVLDLLPESTRDERNDKPESFFIRIKDDNCECDKENFNVADRMPEKIRERLFRRHRRRQLRAECARRSRGKQLRIDADNQQKDEPSKTKREIERECVAIINSLIDEVIAKIAKEEFKCARIKRKSERRAPTKCEENSSKKNRKKNLRSSDPTLSAAAKVSPNRVGVVGDSRQTEEKHKVHGKLSLMTRPALNLVDAAPRRIYQKSEILEGNKCIEILEIVEYMNDTQSNPDTVVSDDSPGGATRGGRRSRIPVPVPERHQRSYPSEPRRISNSADNSPASPQDAHTEDPLSGGRRRRASDGDLRTVGVDPPTSRRVFFPPSMDSRPRSDSLRFHRVFDIIPEERSSLSVDSSPEVERVSTTSSVAAPHPSPAPRTRSVATSPLGAGSVGVAAPLRVKGGDRPRRARVWAPISRREEGVRNSMDKGTRAEPVVGANPTPKRDNKTKTEKKTIFSKLGERHKPVHSDLKNHVEEATKPITNVQEKKPFDQHPRKSEGESSLGTELAPGSEGEVESSSEGSERDGGLLCSRWRRTHRRRRSHAMSHRDSGGWSVTVAGSCPGALPADVEMRLRFPQPHQTHPTQPPYQRCSCRTRVSCACSAATERVCSPTPVSAATLPPPARRRLSHNDTKLTLTMKKEARDSSILTSKSMRKSIDPLPDLETYRSSRSKVKSSVKGK